MSSNMFDQDQVDAYIKRIEGLDSEIATSKSNHMTFARKKGEEKDKVFNEAKENGIPKKVLSKILKRRVLQGQMDDLEEDLDDDFKPLFQNLKEVFANYQPPKQTSMFSDEDGEDGEKGDDGFDPDFVDPAAEQQQRELDEGAEILGEKG